MSAVSWVRSLLLLFLAITTVEGQVYQGRQLVEAQAVANVNAIVPGETFLIGVRLKIAPGWHTYWRYPGDAGIPTDVQWQLPTGWQVGPIQWPIPLKLKEPGDIQIYGYHDDVLLIQQITPPKELASGEVALRAKVSWLVCEKICIPGDAAVQVSLPVSTSNKPANAALFSQFEKQLPQSISGSVSVKWQRDENDLLLHIDSADLIAASSVDFFPAPAENVLVGHPRLESQSGGRLTFRMSVDSPNRSSLPGLIVFEKGGQRIGWEISAANQLSQSAAPAVNRDLLRFLLLGLLGGFILNLMPCVLPVISLKIFGFVQQAGQSRRAILRSGIAFVAGIFAWFIGLALVLVILKAAGREITWAFQFTNPYFVLAMSAIVLVFALNLLGVFEISLPQWVNRTATAAASSHSDAGSFFQGVFATILATPCTAPFLGTALGFAFTQTASVILLMFAAIAAGMSAPYLLLSAQPAWLRYLPKPGLWMVRVKQLMGFLLLATLLFLLSVLGAQRGASGLVWTSAFLLVLSVACWIKGAFLTAVASRRQRVTAVTILVALLSAGAWYFVGVKFSSTSMVSESPRERNGWEKFTPERLKAEIEQGHAVFIDFTAEWCITCKFNEATVLESNAVRAAFTQRQIIKLRADWTNGDPAITKLLKQFGRPGVPLYVLYPGGTAQPYVFPELLTKDLVLQKLETVNHSIASQ